MPGIANITVKNQANVDVVYVAAVPSAGDKMPAIWSLNAASTIVGHRPKYKAMTRDNGSKTARVLECSMTFPIIETIDGRAVQTALVPLTLSATLPTNVDSTLVQEAFVQFGNLNVSTLTRSMASEGYAAT